MNASATPPKLVNRMKACTYQVVSESWSSRDKCFHLVSLFDYVLHIVLCCSPIILACLAVLNLVLDFECCLDQS